MKMTSPESLYVSGMPLMHRGWNGEYVLDKKNEEYPEWGLYSHNYYGLGICDTAIVKIGDRWTIRNTDWYEIITRGPTGHSPIGDWGDVLITTEENWSTWFRSNFGIALLITSVASMVSGVCWYFL